MKEHRLFCKSHHKFVALLIIMHGVLFVCSQHASGTWLPPMNGYLHGSAGVQIGDVANAAQPSPGTGVEADRQVLDIISLSYDHTSNIFISANQSIEAVITIVAKDETGTVISTITGCTLNLEIRPFTDINPFTDLNYYHFEDAYDVQITLTSLKINGVFWPTGTNIPAYINIESEIRVERFYEFSAAQSTPILFNAINAVDLDGNSVNDELEISWPTVTEAEEYHLEWVYVNNYTGVLNTPLAATAVKYDFREGASRVTVDGATTRHRLSLLYDRGYLIFRVRPMGRDYLDPEKIIYGSWNTAEDGTVASIPATQYAVFEIKNTGANLQHEANKNWQLSVNFAEEGKKKEVVSYFDGALYNRQSVTRNNSDNRVIVGETIYDYQGRPAVSILPAPVAPPTGGVQQAPIRYYYKFNQNTSGKAYSKSDFDEDVNTCETQAAELDAISGTSMYYSPNNAELNIYQNRFIPHAEGFPFTQTEYTPDNTGRIRNQGGVGPEFQLGNFHETKYLYGQPNQVQLDRLFGSEVGWAAHYKKNVVIDPNGQTSVTYLNQSGKTVATALAGGPPIVDNTQILESLNTEAGANKDFTVDLFNKDANGVSVTNHINTLQNGIEFTTQLLVAYESVFYFNYDIRIEPLQLMCHQDRFCFHCIYDLEIGVTDECGEYVPALQNPANPAVSQPNPITDMVGHFTGIGNSIVFSVDITDGTTSYQVPDPGQLYSVHLLPGVYTITKKLTINEDAQKFYVDGYLNNAGWTVRDCIGTLESFIAGALAGLNTSGCFISCQDCIDALGTKDEFVAAGKGTALQYDLLTEDCLEPCTPMSVCQTTYQQMLADVSLHGQYGKVDLVAGTAIDHVSVFNVENHLPENSSAPWTSTGNGSWKKPVTVINGNFYPGYYTDKGERVRVYLFDYNPITPVIPTDPETDPGAPIFHDDLNNQYYTWPEYLVKVGDFFPLWQRSFARALVRFHPEFAYYAACNSEKYKHGIDVLSSDEFDELLSNINNFDDAVSKYIKTNHASITDHNLRIYDLLDPTSPYSDPFFTNDFFEQSPINYGVDLKALMQDRIDNFQEIGGVTYSMIEVASMMARCGTYYGSVPGAACFDFGAGTNSVVDVEIRNTEWKNFLSFYLSEKQKLKFQRWNLFALSSTGSTITPVGCNICIGNDQFNPFIGNLISWNANPFGWNYGGSPFGSYQQPCSWWHGRYYRECKKRFIKPGEIPGMNPENTAYNAYVLTGQCPVTIQFQTLLDEIAVKDLLTSPIDFNLTTISTFTPDLYKAVSGGSWPAQQISYKWHYVSTIGNTWNYEIQDPSGTGVCSISLDLTYVPNINDIERIVNLQFSQFSSGLYYFTADAWTLNTSGTGWVYNTHVITGSTCINIRDCEFEPECIPNDLAVELQLVMNFLASNGDLEKPHVPLMGSSLYDPYLLDNIPVITNTMAATNPYKMFWHNLSLTPWVSELYFENNSGSQIGKKIIVKLNQFSSVTYPPLQAGASPVEAFRGIKPNYFNQFKIEGIDSDELLLVELDGTVDLHDITANTTTGISLGECEMPPPIDCKDSKHEIVEDLENLISDILVNSTSLNGIDILTNPYMTGLLLSYIPEQGTPPSSTYSSGTSGSVPNQIDYDELNFNLDGCEFRLYRSDVHTTPPLHFDDIVSIGPITATGLIDDQMFYHDFYFTATYDPIGPGQLQTATVYGTSCLSIKNCDSCSVVVPPPPPSGGGTRIAYERYIQKAVEEGRMQYIPNSQSYMQYVAVVDSINATMNWTKENTLFVEKIGYKDFIKLEISQKLAAYYSYVNNFDASVDNAELLDIKKFHSKNEINNAILRLNGCDGLFADYVNMVNAFNSSSYSSYYQYTLPTGLFTTSKVFSDSGYCDCVEEYIDYLSAYLNQPPAPIVTLALPYSITLYPGCMDYVQPEDTCLELYYVYLDEVILYNHYATKDSLPNILAVISEAEWMSEEYCMCLEKYLATLQAILNGIIVGDDAINYALLFERACDSVPCVDQLPQANVLPPVPPAADPCVEQLIDFTVANATMEFEEYYNNLVTQVSEEYRRHCISALENFTYNYNDKEYHFTLYYYDQAGNLVKTIPPDGVEMLDCASFADQLSIDINKDRTFGKHTVFTNHRLPTVYEYNSLNQLTRQVLPDHDRIDAIDYILPEYLSNKLSITNSQFVSSQKGFLSGFLSAPSHPDRGVVYTSGDGGESWNRLNGLVSADLNDVDFDPDYPEIGFAVGNYGVVIKTMDGGSSWDALNTYGLSHSGNLYAVCAKNDVVVFGGLWNAGSGMFYSVGGGAINVAAGGIDNFDIITSITHDGTEFYASTKNNGVGKIYSSPDGNNWTKQTNYKAGKLNHIQYASSSTAWAVGDDGTLLRGVYTTQWEWFLVPTGIARDFKNVYFRSALVGIAIIDDGNGKGQIFATLNGGLLWTRISDVADDYTSFEPYDLTNHKLIASGKNGLVARLVSNSTNFGAPIQLTAPFTNDHVAGTNAYINTNLPAQPQVIVAGTNGTTSDLYITTDAIGSNATWLAYPTNPPLPPGILEILASPLNDPGDGFIALILDNNKQLHYIVRDNVIPGQPIPVPLNVVDLTGDFSQIEFEGNNGTEIVFYAYESTVNRIYKIGFNIASNYTTVSNTPIVSNTISSAINSLSIWNYQALICGNDGLIASCSDFNNVPTWQDESMNVIPPTINDIIAFSNPDVVAVGVDGTAWKKYAGANLFELLNTGTSDEFTCIDAPSSGLGYIGTADGKIIQAQPGATWTFDALDENIQIGTSTTVAEVNTGSKVTGIALDNSSLYASCESGKVLFIPNISNIETQMSSTSNSGGLTEIVVNTATNGTSATAVGTGCGVYTHLGTSYGKVNEIFLPKIVSSHFVNASNGYVVAIDGNLRHTTDGGNSWSIVLPAFTQLNGINKVWTRKPDDAILIGDGGYSRYINGSFLNNTPISVSPAVNLHDINFYNNDYGVIVGENGNTWSIVPFMGSYNVNALGVTPNSYSMNAVHVFYDNSFITAGQNSNVFYYDINTSAFYEQTNGIPSSLTFNDLWFHDDRMGYVVGEDGEAYKVSAEGNIQEPTIGGTLNSSAFLWEKFDLLDPFGIYLNGISDIKTVAFADRYRGFFGGINPGPDYLYSILVNDESEYFSGKFWYDKVGRMILSQNTRQFNKTPKSYIYTMYDALGRVIESGEKTENSVAGEPNFASIFGSEINGYINQQTIDNTKFNNWIVASGIRTEVIQTYYDFQEFTSLGITQDHLQNRIASSTYEDLFDNINNTYNYATHYSYDIHGNTKVLWQENRELPSAISNQELKRIDYNFDLISGKVNQVSYQPGEVDAFYHKYEYDADNRLVRTETSTDDIFYDTDARYYYYPHGALARVEYGDINVQGMDYAYTLQGRIKGVNSNLLKPNLDIGRDGYIPTSALEAANPNQNFAYDAMGFTLGYRIKDYFPIDDDISIFNVWNDDKRFEANWYFQNNSAIGSDLLDNRHNLYNGNISSMVTTLPDELTITNSTTLSDITVGINGYSYKYDQLNRLMDAVAFENVETNSTAIGYNSWKNEANPTLKYGNSFEYDANGNILTQVRNDASNNTFDNLSYKYLETAGNRLQNRLYHVEETEPDNDMPDDIDHIDAFEPDPNLINSDNIFSYDELGNLVKDEGSKIASISWTVSGKIRNIVRESGSTLPDLEFRYDASGNRIMKIVKPAGSGNDPNQWITTHYVHDAAGHIMVTYEETTPSNATEYILKERTIYGSSRVGIYTREVDMIAATMSDEGSRDLGKKCLELTNHLSNVLAVVSDKKIPIQDGSTGDIDYFLADIVSVSDYYPFGAPLVGRAHDTENYRFGFNGKENDNEVKYDVNDDPIIGAQQEYGMRIYDNRIARFLSVDPLTASYPFKTPYDFAENGPIQYLDLDGLEKLDFETHWAMGAASGNAGIGLVTYAFDWLTSGIVDMSEGMIQKAENYAIHNTENAYTINVPENVRSTREKVIDQEATAKAYGGMLDWYSKCQTIMGGAMGPLEGGQLAITTRQTIAASYYAKAGFKAADAASHMTGIDFTKNVERVILKKGTIIQQWVRKEGTGDYFTTIENGSKQNLGIGYEGRQLQQFVVEQDVEVLKSTASEVDGAVGGGVQYFINPAQKAAVKPL